MKVSLMSAFYTDKHCLGSQSRKNKNPTSTQNQYLSFYGYNEMYLLSNQIELCLINI